MYSLTERFAPCHPHLIDQSLPFIPQAMALSVFPRVCVKHTGKEVEGQIYIGTINYILMILTIAVVGGFQANSVQIGNAYGEGCLAMK